jgi:hypothetical protein
MQCAQDLQWSLGIGDRSADQRPRTGRTSVFRWQKPLTIYGKLTLRQSSCKCLHALAREQPDGTTGFAHGSCSVTPKFVSLSDPAAQWTGALRGPAFFAYSDNYLIDVKFGIIIDVEASRAIRQQTSTGLSTRRRSRRISRWLISRSAKMEHSAGKTLRSTRSGMYTSARQARSSGPRASLSTMGRRFCILRARTIAVTACSRRDAVPRAFTQAPA